MLNQLWTHLLTATTSGAPDDCEGLMRVPFNLDRQWFVQEYLIRVSQWYKTKKGEVIVPEGTVERILRDLPQARIQSHHLTCCAIEVPGVSNGALAVHYELSGLRHWVALPGITYRLRNP